MSTDVSEVLRWITGLLDDLGIEYQVVGGLAARCYGSIRPLVDIDLYVPDEASLERIASAAEGRITRPPTAHRDDHWDLTFLALEWGDWRIEIAAAGTAKIRDQEAGRWVASAIKFKESEIIDMSGIELRVMPKHDLIRYKRRLGRRVDRIDIDAMQSAEES